MANFRLTINKLKVNILVLQVQGPTIGVGH